MRFAAAVVDTGVMPGTGGMFPPCGWATAWDSSAGAGGRRAQIQIVFRGGNDLGIYDGMHFYYEGANQIVTNTAPFAWESGDSLWFDFEVPAL